MIELKIIEALRKLLTGRVMEILLDFPQYTQFFDKGYFHDLQSISPTITVRICKRTEKERIIRLRTYIVNIFFELPDTPDSEFFSYLYSNSVFRALHENLTLDGSVFFAGGKSVDFKQPEKPGCGESWKIVITLNVSVIERW